ncbi:hypothetical protein ACFQX9_18250 [Bradyrhizobium sp. GCM10028915]|uniref:hypothetical protein n=1 Tax=Bradyrhizobium sp. GCM10028915 TaxID=3273385 RepID=UPI0036144232
MAPVHQSIRAVGSSQALRMRSKSGVPLVGIALLVWMFSGNPTLTSTANYVAFQIIGFLVELVICFPRLRYFDRLRPFFVICMLYVVWFALSVVGGMSDQIVGLLGQLLKIGMVAVLFAAAPKPIEALVESMLIICKVALLIFALRHLLLLAGMDLADYFTPMYSLTGETSERSIIIFNFHTAEDTYRNSGPFREPGIFAANLVISMVLLLARRADYSRSERTTRFLVFGAALVTTGSTMGLLAMVPVGAIILGRLPSAATITYLLVGAAVVISVFFVLSDSNPIEKIDRQLQATEMRSNTWYQSRFGNAYVDYIAVMARPLVGYGFAETGRPILWDTRIQSQYVGEGNIGFGNGLTGTFVKFGIPVVLAIYAYFSLSLFALSGGRFAGTMSALAFFMILFSQQLLLLPAVYALCIGHASAVQRRKREHRGWAATAPNRTPKSTVKAPNRAADASSEQP